MSLLPSTETPKASPSTCISPQSYLGFSHCGLCIKGCTAGFGLYLECYDPSHVSASPQNLSWMEVREGGPEETNLSRLNTEKIIPKLQFFIISYK